MMQGWVACLLEGFIVDKACGILGEVELSSLDLLSELPVPTSQKSAFRKRKIEEPIPTTLSG
jgi:hypothetical protein